MQRSGVRRITPCASGCRTDRLTGLGLTTGDIINAVKSQNIQAAVGRVGARPIADEQQLQLNIQTQGRLSSVGEFENIVVRTNPDGSVLRLSDVARVELGAANLDRETRLNGGPASAVAIYQTPGANAIATLKAVRDRIGELQSRFPDDLAWKVTYDPTSFVTATIEEVKKTLVEAFVLVVIVVFLFLGSLRATLIPTLAVPVSLIGTFIALKMIGYSANSVSLLALVLAIGIVVDDAIVVVENVERVMEEHPELSPASATKQAMSEITAPIIGITLVLLSVFVPVAFIPGISGELFRQFAVTVAVAMFLSAINALTLSPALCAVLLRPHHGPRRGVIGLVMRSIDRVRDGYGAAVARILPFSFVGLVAVAVAGAGIFALAKLTPTGFLPEDDQGALFVVVQMPGGSAVARTSEAVRQAENILREEEAVADYTSVIGLNFIDNYSQPNAAFMVVTLKPFEERKDRSLGVPALMDRLSVKFREIAGGTVVPLSPPPILGLGTGGGFTYVLQDLSGGDPKALAQALRGLTVAANQDPQLTRVFSTFSATNPSIYLDIDRNKVQILGVQLNDVFQALQASLGGFYVNDLNLFGRRWQVNIQAEGVDRGKIDDIYRINVRNAEGKMIPLRSLLEARVVVGPPALIRYNNLRAVTVQGSPAPGISSGQALKAMEDVAARTLPAGFAGEWTDTAFQEKRAEGKTALILGFAVLFAYLFLVGLYESWTIPVPVLLSVSVGILGSFAAILLGGLTLDLYGQIGMIVLIGLGGEERYPHRRVREAREGARRSSARGGNGGRSPALPARDDDVARLHPGTSAVGGGGRRLAARAPERRHAGLRRHDRGIVHRYLRHPAALCDLSEHSGEAQTVGTAQGTAERRGARCRENSSLKKLMYRRLAAYLADVLHTLHPPPLPGLIEIMSRNTPLALAPIIRGSRRLAVQARRIRRVDGGGCCGTLATRW